MPEAPTIDDRTTDYVFALAAEFPGLTSDDISICDEPDAALTRVDWDGWTALFAQSEVAASRLSVMSAVMPHLRGFVSPAVPMWEHGNRSEEWKRTWLAAQQPEGRPLEPALIVDQNRDALVRDLATFFHELHQFSVERARGLGAASFRAWRDEHAALSRRSQSVLTPLLSWSDMTWARKWWSRFLNDETVWRITPSLVHGGVSAQRLLVDPLVRELAAVTGWHGVRVADPALDLAHLVDTYGTDLGWRIVERYGELGSTADAALFRRIRLQQTVRRFRDVVEVAERDGADSEATIAALKRLR